NMQSALSSCRVPGVTAVNVQHAPKPLVKAKKRTQNPQASSGNSDHAESTTYTPKLPISGRR
ncbi:MAG: hypothetical protein ACRD0Y_07430, partial [Terriglobales bacterium]